MKTKRRQLSQKLRCRSRCRKIRLLCTHRFDRAVFRRSLPTNFRSSKCVDSSWRRKPRRQSFSTLQAFAVLRAASSLACLRTAERIVCIFACPQKSFVANNKKRMNELVPVCDWAQVLTMPSETSLRLSRLALIIWPLAQHSNDPIEWINAALMALGLFCDEVGTAVAHQCNSFQFAMCCAGSQLSAVAVASRSKGARLIVLGRQSCRVFVCQLKTASDRQFLQMTTGNSLALLSDEICDAECFASQSLARLFHLQLIDARCFEFISDLVRSTVHVYEKHAETAPLRLQKLAPALAGKAPAGFDAGDIYACVSALYIGLTGALDEVAMQRLLDLLAVMDQAIFRCTQLHTSQRGQVIDL